MTNRKTGSFDVLQEIMLAMQEAANNEEWELIVSLDSKRRETIDELLLLKNNSAENSDGAQVENIRAEQSEVVQLLIEMDRKIHSTIALARENFLSKNREFSAQKNAASGYAKTSTFM